MYTLEYNLISILLPNKMHAIECLPFKIIHDKKSVTCPGNLNWENVVANLIFSIRKKSRIW